MKKPIVILTTLMLLTSPAHADWDEISNKMSELGEAVSDTAQDVWDDTKAFSKQAWQDFTNCISKKQSIRLANGQMPVSKKAKNGQMPQTKKLMS